MVQVAIVEDDILSQNLLRDYLHRYGKEYKEVFEVSVFYDGQEIANNYQSKFDIILLDVKMENMDGFTTAKRIRAVDSDVILIFITNMGQYAIKGYEVDALSYLLKPVSYFAFSQELKRSLQRMQKRKTKYLILSNDYGHLRLDTMKILYIGRDKHRISIHTEKQIHSMVGTIKETAERLDNSHFFRCNSGYIVNMSHVTGVQDNFVLVGKYRLQISRPKRKAFLKALTDYFGRIGK
ncbi:MAG: LytTR family DNA-binding domain-containing protein [Treponema sp.]|jgi:DNA-binding LytR/AlgR family response regulator|nr:LytTR family DNA-binding domain-containing protein [Treponema sp.]